MKLEDFAYSVTQRALGLLETEHHYKVPDHVRKQILEKIAQQLDEIVAGQPKT